MIRRWLHRRWFARRGAAGVFWPLRHWRWIDTYCNWNVARYGEHVGDEPRWLRPVSRFVVWCDDWRTTIGIGVGRWP